MVFVDHLWPHSEFLCLKLFLESGEFQVQGLEGILELTTQKKKKINSLQYTNTHKKLCIYNLMSLCLLRLPTWKAVGTT